MSTVTVLQGVELIPVIELEPFRFSTRERPFPLGVGKEEIDERHWHWQDSLADSGVIGLRPLYAGGWHVPTSQFSGLLPLQPVLEAVFREAGGVEILSDLDSVPVLCGGLALRCPSGVLIEPICCSDLADASEWREAASHRGGEWRMVWIGHPWISVRYEAPLLVLSQPHESANPTSCWAVHPGELDRAFADAEAELARFAGEIASVLPALGCRDDPRQTARRLAGLPF